MLLISSGQSTTAADNRSGASSLDSGILHVGVSAARALADAFPNLDALMAATADGLQRIPDVGEVVGASIAQFFQEKHNREMIAKLKAAGLRLTNEAKPKRASDSEISGTTWVITEYA